MHAIGRRKSSGVVQGHRDREKGGFGIVNPERVNCEKTKGFRILRCGGTNYEKNPEGIHL
jgi:hypothetical protein